MKHSVAWKPYSQILPAGVCVFGFFCYGSRQNNFVSNIFGSYFLLSVILDCFSLVYFNFLLLVKILLTKNPIKNLDGANFKGTNQECLSFLLIIKKKKSRGLPERMKSFTEQVT